MKNPMDRPKYGMITNPSRDILSEIGVARRLGFDYVELGLEIPEGHPDVLRKKRSKILKALKGFRHPPVAHSPYWIDLWSEYEEVRQAYIRVVKRTTDVSASLGCRKFSIHAPIIHGMYKYNAQLKKRTLNNMITSLRELVRYASGKRMTIMLENMDPFGISFKEYSNIISKVPRLGVHVDVGHAFIEGRIRKASRYMKTFRNRLEHVHFSDNMGEEDEHLGIGQGAIDYFRVMEILKGIRYSRSITLEVFSSRRKLRDSLRLVKAIEEEVWSR